MKRAQAIGLVFVMCFVLAGLLTWIIANPPAANVAPTLVPTVEITLEPALKPASNSSVISSTASINAEAEPGAGSVITSPSNAASNMASVSVTPEDAAVNIRSGPGTDYEVVGRLANAETIAVVGRNSAGDWLQVEQGWVNTEVVLITGDINTLPIINGDTTSTAP